MPEYLSPGVYVEEIEIGGKPIEGVSTSTAGFLGPTERGPETPTLITGFEQFRRLYGGYLDPNRSYFAYGVEGFFTNGGRRCFIGRIVAADAVTTTASDGATITMEAVGPGVWGNQIAVKIRARQPKLGCSSLLQTDGHVLGHYAAAAPGRSH